MEAPPPWGARCRALGWRTIERTGKPPALVRPVPTAPRGGRPRSLADAQRTPARASTPSPRSYRQELGLGGPPKRGGRLRWRCLRGSWCASLESLVDGCDPLLACALTTVALEDGLGLVTASAQPPQIESVEEALGLQLPGCDVVDVCGWLCSSRLEAWHTEGLVSQYSGAGFSPRAGFESGVHITPRGAPLPSKGGRTRWLEPAHAIAGAILRPRRWLLPRSFSVVFSDGWHGQNAPFIRYRAALYGAPLWMLMSSRLGARSTRSALPPNSFGKFPNSPTLPAQILPQ